MASSPIITKQASKTGSLEIPTIKNEPLTTTKPFTAIKPSTTIKPSLTGGTKPNKKRSRAAALAGDTCDTETRDMVETQPMDPAVFSTTSAFAPTTTTKAAPAAPKVKETKKIKVKETKNKAKTTKKKNVKKTNPLFCQRTTPTCLAPIFSGSLFNDRKHWYRPNTTETKDHHPRVISDKQVEFVTKCFTDAQKSTMNTMVEGVPTEEAVKEARDVVKSSLKLAAPFVAPSFKMLGTTAFGGSELEENPTLILGFMAGAQRQITAALSGRLDGALAVLARAVQGPLATSTGPKADDSGSESDSSLSENDSGSESESERESDSSENAGDGGDVNPLMEAVSQLY